MIIQVDFLKLFEKKNCVLQNWWFRSMGNIMLRGVDLIRRSYKRTLVLQPLLLH